MLKLCNRCNLKILNLNVYSSNTYQRKIRKIVLLPSTSILARNLSSESSYDSVAFNLSQPIINSDVTTKVSEQTLTSLGLGGNTPVGLVQTCLDFLHVSLDIPWWGAIVIGTVCVRLAMFPLVIKAQKNAALMHNNMPEMQVLQLKMTQARKSGDQLQAAACAHEMMMFMRDRQINPLKNFIVPLAQAPFFISFFLGLRGMANAPVESMMTGGMYWFNDLTIPDQLYILPLITSATLWATIELGTDGGAKLNAPNMQMVKWLFRAMPFIMIPFTINFPGAILVYWCSSNFISLIQVGVLKLPAVREYFKIPKLLDHKPEDYPINTVSFTESAKESIMNMKIANEIADRQRVEEMIKSSKKDEIASALSAKK